MTADYRTAWKALHALLLGISPAWPTTKPYEVAAPHAATYWQRGTFIPGEPLAVAFGGGAYSRVQGIYQVDLFYPKPLQDVDTLLGRAELVRDTFWPYRRSYVVGGAVVDQLPRVSSLMTEEPAHNRIMVEVYFYLDDNPT